MYIVCRNYDRYGESSNQAARDYFYELNKDALKTAMRNKSNIELNLILCKIYLYLGHHYMDLHLYERAMNLADKCQSLSVEIEEASSYFTEVNK